MFTSTNDKNGKSKYAPLLFNEMGQFQISIPIGKIPYRTIEIPWPIEPYYQGFKVLIVVNTIVLF